jgi:hypothetical protein
MQRRVSIVQARVDLREREREKERERGERAAREGGDFRKGSAGKRVARLSRQEIRMSGISKRERGREKERVSRRSKITVAEEDAKGAERIRRFRVRERIRR